MNLEKTIRMNAGEYVALFLWPVFLILGWYLGRISDANTFIDFLGRSLAAAVMLGGTLNMYLRFFHRLKNWADQLISLMKRIA